MRIIHASCFIQAAEIWSIIAKNRDIVINPGKIFTENDIQKECLGVSIPIFNIFLGWIIVLVWFYHKD